jgi:MFS family permease
MTSNRSAALVIAWLGLAGLASAMGIGRFAFTPALPLMQAADGLTLVQGGWLASVNYAGYLIGALLCIWLPSRPALWARVGLLLVAIVTLAMAAGDHFALWLLWRLLAGLASAFVLVGLSAWCLGQLAALNRSDLAGLIYAGVGVGVALAGLVGMGAGLYALASAWFWVSLGVLALLVWLIGRSRLAHELPDPVGKTSAVSAHFSADHWRLIVCYGIFGIGYILPATFLPAMARDQLGDPALFGWIWPVFGAAAALSTLLVARFAGHFPPRRIWALAAIVMTVGVALPVLSQGMASLMISALCVGGTFMVMTMAGMQEARTQGGARLIAAMTSSFAAGQIAGPLLVNLAHGSLVWPSLAGATLLLVSVVLLLFRATR